MTEQQAVTLPNANNGVRRTAALPARGASRRQYQRFALASALAALASACGGYGDTVTIEKTRIAAVPSKTALPGADLRSRLGMGGRAEQPTAGASQPDPAELAALFTYDLPDGWEALEPTQFRLINLRFRAVPMAEITFIILGGDGGGLAANVNRWRAQVGLEPATDLEVAAYPERNVFENAATYVEFNGPYQGMGGPKIEDGALYGVVLPRDGRTLFVKMTGPRGTLEAERAHFAEFMDSLGLSAEATRATSAPSGGQGVQGGQPAGGSTSGAQRPSPLTWTAPGGWSEEIAPSPFREVTFRRGSVEMYISLARGGALANINRWAGQLGLTAIDAAGVDALPRAPMLGREAYIYEGEGTLKGMRDPAPKPDQRMLAALVEDGGLIVTVKMTGPSADVDAARDDFLALLATIANR